jgi:hypothetical protein
MKQTKTWLSPNDRGDLVTVEAIVELEKSIISSFSPTFELDQM